MSDIIYASYTQAELDAQYDNQRAFPNARATLDLCKRMSAEAAGLPGERDVRWGSHPLALLDTYRPAQGADLPVVVFVHGGAWISVDKEECAYAAPAFVESGCLFVVLGFPDAADGPFAEMVAGIREAVGWVGRNVARLGGDPARVALIGHSSGTHLVTQCLTHDWAAAGLGAAPFCGALAISGLCDLEPVRLSYRNQRLHLTPQDVIDYSLVHRQPAPVPVAVAYSEKDTGEFRRQAQAMAAYLKRFGRLAAEEDVAGRDHFDVVFELSDRSSRLHHIVLDFLGAGGASA